MQNKTNKPNKTEKEIVLLVDSHALLHRAYHAMANMMSGDGKPSGALFGFVKMIHTAANSLRPEHVICCYDLPKPTFRHLAFAEYKGTRVKSDDALRDQILESKNFAEAMGIPIYELEGFEADDLLGTLSHKIDKEKYEVIIFSGDMDVMQLIEDGVKVFAQRKGTDVEMYGEAEVVKRYGITPKQIPDYKGLAGDSSDNIPGVSGIGEKTAVKLIAEFDNLETLYEVLNSDKAEDVERLESVVSKRIIEKLKSEHDEAIFSKTLATIRRDAPIDIKEFKTFGSDIDTEKYKRLCDEYDLRSLKSYFDKKSETQNDIVNKIVEDEEGLEIKESLPAEELEELQIISALLNSEKTKLTFVDIKNLYALKSEISFVEAKEELLSRLEKENLIDYYNNIEKKITPILKVMMGWGISVNVEELEKQKLNIKGMIDRLEKEIHDMAGQEFLISSPKQLGEILYEKLALGVKIKKTSTGKLSTNADMLEKLKDDHPIINKILEWREVSKIYGTYLEPMIKYVHADGKVHPHFLQLGASTGRFSCENPNMQNLPIKSELGQLVRNIFVAEEGKSLISIDYSQIDLRAAAILSKDERFIDIFKRGIDVHKGVAAQTLHKSEEEVTPQERSKAKAINFGILYGMGVSALKEAMHSERKEAQEFYDTYKETFSTLMIYLENVKDRAKRLGYTETLFGRRRDVPLLRSPIPFMRAQGERMAINAPVQGSSADILKLGMVDVWEDFKIDFETGKLKMLLQIHDELVFECDTKDAKIYGERISKVMIDVLSKRNINIVPLEASVNIGHSLGELKN
jgi:DNA polymerase-1